MRPLPMAPLLLVLALPGALLSHVARADFVINELMRRNDYWTGASYLDEDGMRQGWVELKNTGAVASSLQDWSISDDQSVPLRFVLPAVSVDPGKTVLVWLSGKNRAATGAPLHANFSWLEGGNFYLFDPQMTLADSVVETRIPVDGSFGRCSENDAPGYYYATPSPGQANNYGHIVSFVIPEDHVSLPVGQPYQLRVWPNVDVTWRSDNPKVSVSATGVLSATQDVLAPGVAPGGRAVVTATRVGTSQKASVDVTIVNWSANISSLDLTAIPEIDLVLGQDETGVYFVNHGVLYKTAAGIGAMQPVGTVPPGLSSGDLMLKTPFGFFLRSSTKIYRSSDLSTWTLEFTAQLGGLQHAFDFAYDASSQTGHVFVGEYSWADPLQEHRVYRGSYPAAGAPTWETILHFSSIAAWQADPSATEAVRHIHMVRVDPYTETLFVGTGDANEHSRIYYSKDYGTTFEILGMGDQSWRTLAMWFTGDSVYWNMDTSTPQSIWRIPRSAQQPGAGWPSLSPELASGTTAPGVRYYVSQNDAPGRFPVGVGGIFVATGATVLDAGHRVRPIDDPAFDYREKVASLANGSLWYQMFANSEQGDLVSLVAAAPEGYLRDYRSRMFGIKEQVAGAPIVQELLLVPSDSTSSISPYTQLIPLGQDPAGFIYFAGRNTAHKFFEARLRWYDDAASAPAEGPLPPPVPEVCHAVPEPSARCGLGAELLALVALMRRMKRVRSGVNRPESR